MPGFHPALVALAGDRRVRPTDIRVYIIACQHLDFEVYRPLKLVVVAHATNLGRTEVSKSLVRLVQCGYLQRGERLDESGPNTFRLPFSWGVRKLPTPHPTSET